ncbi:hypothetical protein [Sphingomonas fennica]|uniref:hypothetical protein n=1 Tax=Edaphosphingomonas fennica TaxID=114404 RepID=UPI001473E6C5|nr:hypothetical protein [Sphingomonas fennica]
MTIQLYIDNEPRNATDNATFERRSPVSGEVVAQGAAAKSVNGGAKVGHSAA